MKTGTITKKKRAEAEAVYEYIKITYKRTLVVPTIRQIQNAFLIKSTSQVWFDLDILERLGKIEKTGKSYKVLSAKITFDDDR